MYCTVTPVYEIRSIIIIAPIAHHSHRSHPPIDATFGNGSSSAIVATHVPSAMVALLDGLLRMILNVSPVSYMASCMVLTAIVPLRDPPSIVNTPHVYI